RYDAPPPAAAQPPALHDALPILLAALHIGPGSDDQRQYPDEHGERQREPHHRPDPGVDAQAVGLPDDHFGIAPCARERDQDRAVEGQDQQDRQVVDGSEREQGQHARGIYPPDGGAPEHAHQRSGHEDRQQRREDDAGKASEFPAQRGFQQHRSTSGWYWSNQGARARRQRVPSARYNRRLRTKATAPRQAAPRCAGEESMQFSTKALPIDKTRTGCVILPVVAGGKLGPAGKAIDSAAGKRLAAAL